MGWATIKALPAEVYMRIYALLVSLVALLASPQPQQQQKKYPWQQEGTNCDKTMTFCWSDSQVRAYGNRWVAPDKDEKPFEWITEVRCLKDYKLCILARNEKVLDGSQTNIDLYRIEEWSNFQIRAIGEDVRYNTVPIYELEIGPPVSRGSSRPNN